jgi:hypothetical protein
MSRASAVAPPVNDQPLECEAEADPDAENVIFVVTGLAPLTVIEGAMLHVSGDWGGVPTVELSEHERATAPVNPPRGVSVMVEVPVLPRVIITLVPESPSSKRLIVVEAVAPA